MTAIDPLSSSFNSMHLLAIIKNLEDNIVNAVLQFLYCCLEN